MSATGTLEEAKQAVIEDFSMYDEWLDKYEYLIERHHLLADPGLFRPHSG